MNAEQDLRTEASIYAEGTGYSTDELVREYRSYCATCEARGEEPLDCGRYFEKYEKLPWETLEMTETCERGDSFCALDHRANKAAIARSLREFRADGQMTGVYFLPIGDQADGLDIYDAESEDYCGDWSDFGPQRADQVNWDGFAAWSALQLGELAISEPIVEERDEREIRCGEHVAYGEVGDDGTTYALAHAPDQASFDAVAAALAAATPAQIVEAIRRGAE